MLSKPIKPTRRMEKRRIHRLDEGSLNLEEFLGTIDVQFDDLCFELIDTIKYGRSLIISAVEYESAESFSNRMNDYEDELKHYNDWAEENFHVINKVIGDKKTRYEQSLDEKQQALTTLAQKEAELNEIKRVINELENKEKHLLGYIKRFSLQ